MGDETGVTRLLVKVRAQGRHESEVVELRWSQIARHAAHLLQSGDWAARDRARLRSELDALLREELMSRFLENVTPTMFDEVIEKLSNRVLSPFEAVQLLLNGTVHHPNHLPVGDGTPFPIEGRAEDEGEENRRIDVTTSSS